MADNVTITEGVGRRISADEVNRVEPDEVMQIIKLGLGSDGNFDNLVSAGAQGESTSLPVLRASDPASFEGLTTLSSGVITTSHQLLLSPLSNLRYIEVQNDLDQNIFLSFDGGVTDHWLIPRKEPRIYDLNAFGKHQTADIHVRAENAPTSGDVRIMAFS